MSSITLRSLKERYRFSVILLRQLVIADFKLRYQGSFLGYLWSLLRPLAIFLIMYIVFLRFLKFDYRVPHDTIYLLVGIVLWNYLADVTSSGVGSIVSKGDLLRKINFPKYVIVLASSFSSLINLCLTGLVICLFMVVDKVDITWNILWIFPLVIELFVMALGVAFILSALFVKLRDLSYIWEVMLQAAFYATPVFYPLVMVPEQAAKWMMLSPPAQLIQDFRHALIPQSSTIDTYWGSPWTRLVPIGMILVVAIFSIYYFRKHSKHFAEDI